jgi:hypothetical protein
MVYESSQKGHNIMIITQHSTAHLYICYTFPALSIRPHQTGYIVIITQEKTLRSNINAACATLFCTTPRNSDLVCREGIKCAIFAMHKRRINMQTDEVSNFGLSLCRTCGTGATLSCEGRLGCGACYRCLFHRRWLAWYWFGWYFSHLVGATCFVRARRVAFGQ